MYIETVGFFSLFFLHGLYTHCDSLCASLLTTQPLVLPAHPKKQRGSITVVAEEMQKSNGLVTLDLSGQHLDKKDMFGEVE